VRYYTDININVSDKSGIFGRIVITSVRPYVWWQDTRYIAAVVADTHVWNT